MIGRKLAVRVPATFLFLLAVFVAGCGPREKTPVDFESPDLTFTIDAEGLDIPGVAYFAHRECPEGTENPLVGKWTEGIWTRDFPPSVGSGTDITFLEDGTVEYVSWNKILVKCDYDDEGNTLTFTPIVCKKQKYAVPDSDPVRYAYRYFPTEAEQMDEIAEGVTWQAYTQTRSQTSRQYGRGQ